MRLEDNIQVLNDGLSEEQLLRLKDYLKTNIKHTLDYFNMNSVNIVIKIINNRKELEKLYTSMFNEIPKEYVVGWINDGNGEVYLLNYNDFNNTPHRGKTFEDYLKTAHHECVHIIHSYFCNRNYPINAIWEGIACYLSNQYEEKSLGELTLSNFLNDSLDYRYYYTLVKKLNMNLSKEEMLGILSSTKDVQPYIEEMLRESKRSSL